ncbi:NB-ARC domains-containing protein [Tanacetum coccineum]
MATTSIPHQWKYDVFVSFRGDDIRKNFMDHMFNDFKQKRIYAYRDDREFPKGEKISPYLYKAIRESKDFHFDRLDLSRFVGSNKANMIGICGISGIGKTILAKAIYNLMYIHFEGGCFCEDVRKQQDLTQVQMQMIGKIIKTDMKISSVGEGIMVIKKMMSSKPILLVLDDVDC